MPTLRQVADVGQRREAAYSLQGPKRQIRLRVRA